MLPWIVTDAYNHLDFYIRQSKDVKHDSTIFLSEFGSDAVPTYNIRHPDPSSPAAHNRYAVALYDAYNPEVLFGEVLLIPEWTLPTLSQDELRRNGGITPPPQPILPNKFIVQLYNPDQQVTVIHYPSTWNSGQHWDFEVPIHTFRQPSSSTLDKAQDDPSLQEATPKIEFRWKRDSKLSKDLLCILSGRKNADIGKKHKEPDIPIAFCRNLKEICLYEPNMNRIDMEDPKGFEITLMLTAITIKDVYFHGIRETFNISESSRTTAVSSSSSPPPHPRASSAPEIYSMGTHSNLGTIPVIAANQQRPSLPHHPPSNPPILATRPPPTDPRTQWEIDVETSRLRKQVEIEERARKHREKAQEKYVKRMMEDERRAARKRQEEIDRETMRLRRVYEAEVKQSRYPGYHPPTPAPHGQNNGYLAPSSGPYQGGSSAFAASTSTFLGGASNTVTPQVKPKRSSFFGLRGGGDEQRRALLKKSSAIF